MGEAQFTHGLCFGVVAAGNIAHQDDVWAIFSKPVPIKAKMYLDACAFQARGHWGVTISIRALYVMALFGQQAGHAPHYGPGNADDMNLFRRREFVHSRLIILCYFWAVKRGIGVWMALEPDEKVELG